MKIRKLAIQNNTTLEGLRRACCVGGVPVSIQEYADYMGLSRNTAEKRLYNLMNMGFVERMIGERRGRVVQLFAPFNFLIDIEGENENG